LVRSPDIIGYVVHSSIVIKRLITFLGNPASFGRNAERNTNGYPGKTTVDQAVDQVIDGIDPRLRLVPGYKRKLKGEVTAALTHIGELVDRVPGPIDVSRRTFVRDPRVSAFFATPDDLQTTFSCSPELKAFFADVKNSGEDECYALLCADKEEKSVLGTELAGDSVQREVSQTAINFHDHKILSPAANDRDVRDGIKHCIFDGLVTHALRHIYDIKTRRQDLEDQRRILHARLRARQAQGNGLSLLLAEAHEGNELTEDIKSKVAEAELKLERMPGSRDVLSFYLEETRNIFASPEEFIRLSVACFRLTDMGIKVNRDTPQSANTVCFSELEITDVMKRVVTVVRYARDDMNCPDKSF
jgi:hypothetical protein